MDNIGCIGICGEMVVGKGGWDCWWGGGVDERVDDEEGVVKVV